MIDLRIGGVPAQTLGFGRVGDVEVMHRWSSTGGGLWYVKFRLALPRGFAHPALREGSVVEVLRGRIPLGTAPLSDIDREGWTFTADGLVRRAEHFNAEDLVGGSSTNMRTVVLAGNARGLGWNGIGNLPDVTVSTAAQTSGSLNTIADVLNAYCAGNGQRWGLDERNRPYVASDPTLPALVIQPGVPTLPTADDDYVSRVTVRYQTGVTGTPPTPTYGLVSASSPVAPHGAREAQEDITDAGVLVTSDAQNYANAYIAAQGARTVYATGVELRREQLTNPGGTPIEPWSAGIAVCGKRLRHLGVFDSDAALTYGRTAEWVVGSTVYRPGEPLQVNPTDIAARTTAQVQAKTRSRALRKRLGLNDAA